VALGEGGQDADQHEPDIRLGGPLLGAGEAVGQVPLVLVEPRARQQPGRDVDLQVELPEFGLEGRVGEVGEHLGVAHRRLAVLVDQVELEFQPGHGSVGVEPELVQHQGEHVEAAAHLVPVPHAVLARERGEGHFLAHRPFPASVRCRCGRRHGGEGTWPVRRRGGDGPLR
jgi:hypothetical protein